MFSCVLKTHTYQKTAFQVVTLTLLMMTTVMTEFCVWKTIVQRISEMVRGDVEGMAHIDGGKFNGLCMQ